MIDTHCHLLPAVDDGARDLAQAVEMARLAAADGFTRLVTTPHWQEGHSAPSPEFLAERRAELQAALDRAGIDVTLDGGAEVALGPGVVEAAEARRLPMLAGSSYVLVDIMPYSDWELVRHLLFELQIRSVKVILAHPERAAPIQEHYERAEELRAGGVKLQVVATSLRRSASPSIRNLARRLIRDGLADLLATDAHDTRFAPPRLAALRRLVDRLGGRGTFERLTLHAPVQLLGG